MSEQRRSHRPTAEELDEKSSAPSKPDESVEAILPVKPEGEEDRERARQRSGEDD